MSSRAVCVVDASVVVKWYIPERDHQAARALRDDYLNGTLDLLAPACLSFEVINALRRRSHSSSQNLPNYGITIIPFCEIETIVTGSETLDIPIYDASYLALAAEHDAAIQTADARLIRSVEETEYTDHVAHIRSYSPGS